MTKKTLKRQSKGFAEIAASKEVYQLSEVSSNKKELILSVLTPTILQFV